MPIDYRIGIYDESKNLIGYKADSFWSLSKKRPKTHWLEDGKIPTHLLKNLKRILNITEVEAGMSIVHAASYLSQSRLPKVMFLGYSEEDSDVVTFTHRVFHDRIEELSSVEVG